MTSPVPQSFDLHPKLDCYEYGKLFRLKQEITCQNHPGVNEKDPNREFGDEDLIFEEGSFVALTGEQQFITITEGHPMSAFIRLQLVCGQRIGWYTVLISPKRIFDFETLRGKRKLYKAAMDEIFEPIKEMT